MALIRELMRWVLGMLLVLAGANHFINTEFYLRIMPPYLPWPTMLVYVSGAAAAILGLMLLVRRVERLAAWGIILLIIAVTPANVHMATHSELYPQFSQAALWVRLLFQVVLIAWAFWYTRPARH